jgi:hypothetical protein
MKRYGLLIVLLYIMIQGCYIQKKEVTKTNLKDVHYLSIEFYPAFDNACYLTIDTSKKIAFLIILSDEYKEVFKGKVSYIDLMNNCNFQSLFYESELKSYQYNPDEIQNEDGMDVKFNYQTKTKKEIIDAGNDYEQKLTDILICSLKEIQVELKDTQIKSYIDKILEYL